MDLLTTDDVADFAEGDLADMLVNWANARVRRIAPCFQGQPSADVIAEAKPMVLRALERTAETEGWVASQTEGPRSITYRHIDAASLLTSSEEAELRALCGHAQLGPGLPLGKFPAPPRISHLFDRRVR